MVFVQSFKNEAMCLFKLSKLGSQRITFDFILVEKKEIFFYPVLLLQSKSDYITSYHLKYSQIMNGVLLKSYWFTLLLLTSCSIACIVYSAVGQRQLQGKHCCRERNQQNKTWNCKHQTAQRYHKSGQ